MFANYAKEVRDLRSAVLWARSTLHKKVVAIVGGWLAGREGREGGGGVGGGEGGGREGEGGEEDSNIQYRFA